MRLFVIALSESKDDTSGQSAGGGFATQLGGATPFGRAQRNSDGGCLAVVIRLRNFANPTEWRHSIDRA